MTEKDTDITDLTYITTKPIIIVEAYEGILTDKDGKLYNLCPEPEAVQ